MDCIPSTRSSIRKVTIKASGVKKEAVLKVVHRNRCFNCDIWAPLGADVGFDSEELLKS